MGYKLFWIRLKTDWWNFLEFVQVVFYYYSNWKFARIDVYFLRSYLPFNPYRMSKEFLKEKGEGNLDVYGETPLTTMDVISRECNFDQNDILYELGCGRGRTCFWLHAFVGCRVYGIEYIPAFIRIAQSIKRKFQIEEVKFLCQDMMEVDLKNATVVYFYGTCTDDETLLKLCRKFEALSSSTKIITISFPLSAYSSRFKTIKSFPVKFPWGETEAYLQMPRTN
jgi:SAM-dependent methyltransferase